LNHDDHSQARARCRRLQWACGISNETGGARGPWRHQHLLDEAYATAALEKVSAKGADELIVQADVSQPAEVERLYRRVRHDSGVWWPMATR